MKINKATLTWIFSLTIVSTIAFGALVPHPNNYYKSNYVILAKNLNSERLIALTRKLQNEWLSFEVSKDQTTIKVTEKAKMHFDYQNGDLINTMSFKQKIIVDLVLRSAYLKTLFWKYILGSL